MIGLVLDIFTRSLEQDQLEPHDFNHLKKRAETIRDP